MLRLVQNIRKYGLSTPILVAPSEIFPGRIRYLVVEGEELWHAACLAGLTHIPCLITQNSPREAEINAIFAKIAAKTADMFEQAALFRHLSDTYALTQEEISRRAGISQSTVANKLRLLRMTDAERQKILSNDLSERHARALLRLRSPAERLCALETICKKKLSVAASEALIESYNTANNAPKHRFCSIQAPITPNVPLSEEKKGGKFVLHTLQPLYNSLERTLSIFRKTGRAANLESEQRPDGIYITIKIPNA
jgi:ParB family chromosome partitioning protein